jgi:hypothetical protein
LSPLSSTHATKKASWQAYWYPGRDVFNKIKQCRRVETSKLAANYLAFVLLCINLLWLRVNEPTPRLVGLNFAVPRSTVKTPLNAPF